MKKFRLFAAMCVLVLALGAMTACGGKATADTSAAETVQESDSAAAADTTGAADSDAAADTTGTADTTTADSDAAADTTTDTTAE